MSYQNVLKKHSVMQMESKILRHASHSVVDVAALDTAPTKSSGGRYMWVGASSAKAKMAAVDEVAIGEAEVRVARDGVQVDPSVPALETEQAGTMLLGTPSME
jgi:hypothetical protein